jgi:hypothetical protein
VLTSTDSSGNVARVQVNPRGRPLRRRSLLCRAFCVFRYYAGVSGTRPYGRKDDTMRRLRMLAQRRVKPVWILPLALMALPDCSTRFADFVVEDPRPQPPRIPPGTTLVPCDLHLNFDEPQCAFAGDLADGVRLAAAAVALVQGDTGKIVGIDDSPKMPPVCGGPEKIVFQGEYPAGLPVCVDPAAVGAGLQFATSTDVCVEKCLDLFDAAIPPDPTVLAFCQQRAQASTNVPPDPNGLFGGACTAAGEPLDTFADPRLEGEPVAWVNAVGVDPTGGDLIRNQPCSATPCNGFDAGAASEKVATHGDGYLEFSVFEGNTNRIAGLTTGKGLDDINVDFTTVGFGIDFFHDGCIYVYENGVPQIPSAPVPATGCVLPANTWGNYSAGDRFRITFVDKFNETATISYAKLPGPCTPGTECPAPPFYTSAVTGAYPLHVDAAFEDLGGALLDVRLVYIH